MPVIDQQDASDVEQHIARIFSSNSPEVRIRGIRRLFAEKLDFEQSSGVVSLQDAPARVELPAVAHQIAELEDAHVVYVHLDTPRVRKAEASEAARLVSNQLGGDTLLVFTNDEADQLHFIYATFEGIRPTLRRMVVERDLPRRTAVMQIANIFHEWESTDSIHLALESAFNVEAVTREFFKEYKRVFDAALDKIGGFGPDESEQEAKKLFTQTLFNRLMFVYFISRKGWLSFDGDKDYLRALWRDYAANASGSEGEPNFRYDRLRPLFFGGLNNDGSQDLTAYPDARRLIGKVPFLNGGLFEENDLDRLTDVTVLDDVIRSIFDDLFGRFNFTVMESTPFDIEVAVDPEMLGKVFEELVTGRHESGSYYTPRPVVSFMCRESLKGFLQGRDTGLKDAAIARFVDDHDTSGVSVAGARSLGRALDEITVVDPACGSGAYLLGMMQELVEVQTALYNAGLDAKSLYDLKLQIIERNLHGADIDPFAINIAMLRLWLSLAIEYDDDGDPPPLPNLDFKIVCGDSLLGPDPSPENYGDLFRHQVNSVAGQLADLKAGYMEATGRPLKDDLKGKIAHVQARLTAALDDSPAPPEAVDWRVIFGEVFSRRGGFDVAIANPPYVNALEFARIHSNDYRQRIKANFNSTRGAWDLYIPFFERSIQTLNQKGILSLITPNKYLSAPYAKELRRLITENGKMVSITDVSNIRIFPSAQVHPVISIYRNGDGACHTFSIILPAATRESFDLSDFYKQEFGHDMLNLLPDHIWGFLLSPHVDLLRKIIRQSSPLSRFGTIQATSTASESDYYGSHLTDTAPAEFFKVINTGVIDPYDIRWGTHRLIHSGSRYNTPYIPQNIVSDSRRVLYSRPKVLYAKLAKRPEAVLDIDGEFAGLNINCFHSPHANISLELIIGFSNSKVFHFLYKQFFGALRMGPSYQFQAPQLRAIPFRLPSVKIRHEIERRVAMTLKDKEDVENLSSQIDELFFKSHGLTNTEVEELLNSI